VRLLRAGFFFALRFLAMIKPPIFETQVYFYTLLVRFQFGQPYLGAYVNGDDGRDIQQIKQRQQLN
jgi:hypothetical protein